MSVEHAALEGAERQQLVHALLDFLARQIASAARAAELQHDGGGVAFAGLRTIGRAFREIADHAGLHHAIAREVEIALELEAELLEVVPMARRDEILVAPSHGELEIVAPAGRAFHQVAEMEHAAAMLQAACPLQLVALYDFHRSLPDPCWPAGDPICNLICCTVMSANPQILT
jgi:hypothetical protein